MHINNPAYEFNIINRYRDAYAFLLDTSIGNIKGGTGKTFDWDKYKELFSNNIFLGVQIENRDLSSIILKKDKF